MAEILFVTWDGGGNVPPALQIAGELRRRGHRTRFLGHRAQHGPVTAEGHGFTAYAEAEDFVGSRPASVAQSIRVFSDRGMGRDLLAEVRRRPADLVVVDALLIGALDAAQRSGQHYVPLQHLFDSYQRGGWLRGPVGAWGWTRGLRPRAAWDEATLNIAATLSDLDPGAAAAPANLRFVGPAVDQPAARADFAEPAVLISLSTIHYPGMQRTLQKLVDAAAGLGVRVVVTTGHAIDPAEIEAPADVEVHRYVRHGDLMPRLSLVVGHGGHGTTMRALAHDLPVLVVPLHPLLDHPVVGRAVHAAGAGATLGRRSSGDRFRTTMATLASDGPHREAAAQLGARIRESDAAVTAATLLEATLNQQRPAEQRG